MALSPFKSPRPPLLILLLLSVHLASGSRMFSLFDDGTDQSFSTRSERALDAQDSSPSSSSPSSSSSINAEEDLGGLNTEWLTDAQLSELGATQGTEQRMAKLRTFYDALEGEARKSATDKIIADCYGWLEEVASEEERETLKQMHHRDHEGCKEKVREMMGRLGQERREQLEKRKGLCEHVWYGKEEENAEEEGVVEEKKHEHRRRWVHRHRRDHHEGHEGHHGHHALEDYFKSHLGWLTDAQKEELKGMKEAGKSRTEMKQKVMEWYDGTTGETRDRATELLKGGCRELIKLVLGEEKAKKVKEMKESGTEVAKIGEQLNAWIAEITDEKKKEMATEYRGVCAKLFGVKPPSRRRRDHHEGHEGHHGHHALEDYFKSHLGWLTDAQKEELKGMKEAGKSRTEMKQKVMEWYDGTTGETRERATELLKGGCRELIKLVLGEEKAKKVKEMKESGTEVAKIGEQLNSWIEEVTDEKKKEMATEYRGVCAKLFGVKAPSRRRRDHHQGHEGHHGHHALEDYFKSHLGWLTDAQKEELKGMKDAGKSRTEMKQKVMEWYDGTTGETRDRATELLKGGCRELIKLVLGEEKATKVKEMKESGTEVAKIGEQLNSWIDEVTDEKKKEMATEYRGVCAKLYGLKPPGAGRRRRSWHNRHRVQRVEEEEGRGRAGDEVGLEEEEEDEAEQEQQQHNLDGEHLHRHNSWLSQKQKKMLKRMRDRGHGDHELHERIHEFYQVSPDEVKATAKGILQRGCESILKRIFGEYKAEEIIQMREEGASNGEIDEKITEALNQIRNPQKREEAGRFAMSCRRIFTMIERRRRSLPAELTLEELAKSHLSWLSEGQIEELKGMRDGGRGRTEMQGKVMEWYGQLEGEAKTKAREHLRDGCRVLLAHVVGKENAEELMRMRKSGAKEAELETKAQQMIGEVQEEGKKETAKEYGETCKKLFLEGEGHGTA